MSLVDHRQVIVQFNSGRFPKESTHDGTGLEPSRRIAARSEPNDRSVPQQVADVLRQFDLEPACLERIGTAVTAAVRQMPRNSAGKTVCVRIFLSGWKRADLAQKQSWGFFVVEKSAIHDESLTYIDLFLFAEGDVQGART